MANASKGLEQYDIEDMDVNNPYMDSKTIKNQEFIIYAEDNF